MNKCLMFGIIDLFFYDFHFSCDDGYYGDPSTPGGRCDPCNCNPEGSVGLNCGNDGRCVCLPGITGDKCDQCQPRYAVDGGVCVCKSIDLLLILYK